MLVTVACMTAVTPVWLLDVDGVLNASRAGWSAAPCTSTVIADGRAWKFRWSPAAVAFVRAQALAGRVEVRWATTWVPWIREVEQALRLPEFACAFTADAARGDALTAKASAALDVVHREQRPLVWTDDDAIPRFGPVREQLDTASNRVLLIAPASSRGLRPEHTEQIEQFLQRW